MLKKSSRPVSGKPTLMADSFTLPSPTNNYIKPLTSPLFPLSPRAFINFSPKPFSNFDSAMSPTSILETKANPFTEQTQKSNNYNQPIGLGIVDALKKPNKPESKKIFFGSQLKIQIPRNGLAESMNSPIEFGIKNKETQLALYSPAQKTTTTPLNLISGCITASEMEMCEEYTCVITHGPNPKTMRFFDNCVVEGCGDVFALTPRETAVKEDDFLASCDACKKKLGEGKDIFMYRGDKAFCSEECRNQEMLFDEQMDGDDGDSWSENSVSTSL